MLNNSLNFQYGQKSKPENNNSNKKEGRINNPLYSSINVRNPSKNDSYNIITGQPSTYVPKDFINKSNSHPNTNNHKLIDDYINRKSQSKRILRQDILNEGKGNIRSTSTSGANSKYTIDHNSHKRGMSSNNLQMIKNKPHTSSQNNKVDNLMLTYKNSPLNNPINVNYSLDNRVSYSNNVQNKNIKSSMNVKPSSLFSSTNLYNNANNYRTGNGNVNNNNNVNNNVDKSNGIYNPSAKCVKEYSYKEEKNLEYRNAMEDYCKIVDKYMADSTRGMFSLYDGHGGAEPVKYVKDRMPELLSKFLIETGHNVEKALNYSFQKVDDELKLLVESDNVGTTACVVYIHRESDILAGTKRIIYCANVGDTRCILINANTVSRLSYDHKSIDDSEVARIKKVGGIIFNGRVFGQLALSRALGDHEMKKYGVICTPYISKHVVTDRDKYIVMCSDGVWDVLTDDDVFTLSYDCKNADELSKLIVETALERGSKDNISCLSVKLN